MVVKQEKVFRGKRRQQESGRQWEAARDSGRYEDVSRDSKRYRAPVRSALFTFMLQHEVVIWSAPASKASSFITE